ncbi:hypothetical protein [Pedobacter sp. JY14-1]|uniref:hypothetical protein n=1 Tax=Pedobacter sp. JY14-1 TaxID=3034151 RepID=UPI0023E2C43F|nr:hypothetical protein [Pedobacter sp. JY14-1]
MNKSIDTALPGGLTLPFFKTIVQNDQPIRIISLIVLCLTVYFPVFFHNFQLNWDDQWVAINAYTEAGLTVKNLWAILTEFYNGQYAPVNQLSYTVLFQLFGYNPFWFHTVGILLHIGNVLLVYFLLKALLAASGSFRQSAAERISFLSAAIMSVHPFLVESVAWVSASKILLYSFFYLLASCYYVKFIRNGRPSSYLMAMLLFILSFGAKEQAVTFPVFMLLIDYATGRNLRNKALWLQKVPFFLLAIFFGYVTLLSQKSTGAGLLSDSVQYPLYQNLVFACYSITEYLVKCLIPVKLSYIYTFPNAIGQPLPLKFWTYPVLIAIMTIAFADFWKKKWVLFGMLFFLLHLGLVLHIIPISRSAIVADRYAYIASVGIFFLIAYLLEVHVLEKQKLKKIALPLIATYILALGLYAHNYSKVWRNSKLLKSDVEKIIRQGK